MARTKRTTETEVEKTSKMGERERFDRRRAWFNMEWSRQEANRYQMALDEDYYDSLQYTPDEAALIRARGQNPVVYNDVKPAVDWYLGTERRMRRDFKVLARHDKTKMAANDAQVKTELLKYLDDVHRAPFERSQVADDQLKAGLGWLYVGITTDPEQELICLRKVSWRNVLHDSLADSHNPRDWRFLFFFKEIDLDIAQAYFPGKEAELARASTDGLGDDADEGWTGIFPSMGLTAQANMPAKYIHYGNDLWITNPRKRVLLIECWNFEPTMDRRPGVQNGQVRMQMNVSIMTKLDTIAEAESPYNHNTYPYIPQWCYRRKRDGMPYGVIRSVRGPQDSLNKRMSKALFEASSRQVRIEKGAVDPEVMDTEELRDEENSPDGMPIYAAGALSGGKVEQVDRKADMAAQLAIADVDRSFIKGGTGVSDENRGAQSNVIAAKGIIAKQEQGSLLTAEPFDNMLFSHQIEGELKISLIEQFYTEEKTFSVTGERFKLDYHTINGRDPITGEKLNDVTRCKAQFVIGDAPWRQTLAQAAFEQAMEMLGHLAPVAPQVVVNMLDLVFEWTDLPNKNLIIQRIREATGATDPDDVDSPEAKQAARKKAVMAQAQYMADLAMLRATVKEAEGKGLKLDAEAMAKKLETVYMSAQAAQIALQMPGAMVVADQLLESVGFEDESGQGTGAVVPAAAAPALPAPGAPVPEPLQADGVTQGIETPAPDGVIPAGATP